MSQFNKNNKTIFIYESCIGQIYLSFKNDCDQYICSQCGDTDIYLGRANNKKELFNVLKEHHIFRNKINELMIDYENKLKR